MNPFQVKSETEEAINFEPLNKVLKLEPASPEASDEQAIPALSDGISDDPPMMSISTMEQTAMELFKELVKQLGKNKFLAPFRHRGGAWLHGDPRHTSILDLENFSKRLESTPHQLLLASIEELMKLLSPLTPLTSASAANKEAEEAMRLIVYKPLESLANRLKLIYERAGYTGHIQKELPTPLIIKREGYNACLERIQSRFTLTFLKDSSTVFCCTEHRLGCLLKQLIEGDEFAGFEWFMQLAERACLNLMKCSECGIMSIKRAKYSLGLIRNSKDILLEDLDSRYATIAEVS